MHTYLVSIIFIHTQFPFGIVCVRDSMNVCVRTILCVCFIMLYTIGTGMYVKCIFLCM